MTTEAQVAQCTADELIASDYSDATVAARLNAAIEGRRMSGSEHGSPEISSSTT
jgi:hypothetical protein